MSYTNPTTTELQEQERREQLLAQLQRLREEVQAQNLDLSTEAAEALAEQFVGEVIEEMVQEGKITYQAHE